MKLQWFAMRVTYSREMKFKKYLDSVHIQNFIPMHYVEITKNGQKQRVIAPIIHNLIFVLSTRSALDEIKQKVLLKEIPVRYLMDRATNEPIVVPSADMNHFIAVCGTLDERLIFLEKVEPILKRGAWVRVTGGNFAGVEGRVVRIKRDRRVMVVIEGVVAVVTAFIDPLLLEPISSAKAIACF